MSATSIHVYCDDEEDAALTFYSDVVPQIASELSWWASEPDKFDAEAGDIIGIEGIVFRVTYEYRTRRVLVGVYLSAVTKTLKEAA